MNGLYVVTMPKLPNVYSKNPYIRTYNFEMSLFWFLFDETLLGTRVQVLNTGHKKNVRKRIVDGSKLQ